MPEEAQEWSESQCKWAAHGAGGTLNETHAVGGVPGLYLLVSATGVKNWPMRYSFGGEFANNTTEELVEMAKKRSLPL